MRRAVLLWLAALSLPAAASPPPAATLAATTLPAQAETATLIQVQAPGRFALVAHSASGAALQLVDMLSGPGDMAGEPGAQDGRIDALLDSGTYKLRVFSAPKSTGNVALSVLPFHDAAPPGPMPPPGTLLSAELADLQQRRFWINVPAPGMLRIAATGRALADLVFFHDGRDLIKLPPATRLVEPEHGHPMTELVAEGQVEPGTYLVIAYGGKPAVWADGVTSMPFHIRSGVSPALNDGWAGGPIGPSGSEVFALPKWAGALRLDLPRAAPVELSGGGAIERIDSKSREPSAVLPVDPENTKYAELRGPAGQAFTLRALQTRAIEPQHPGTYWVSANTLGAGADEVPPTLLLALRDPPSRTRILASTVPHVGPGLAWHTRFNLRGPTDLLVQPDAGGPLTLRTTGVKLDRQFDSHSYIDVPGDLLGLHLVPAAGAFGVLDLTFGPPGQQAALAEPLPPDPVIPLGVQSLWPGQSFFLGTQSAPGSQTWLSARQTPVSLAGGPVIVTQARGQSLTIPVELQPDEVLAAGVVGISGKLDVAVAEAKDGGEDVTIPAPGTPRTVVLSARPKSAPQQAEAVPMPEQASPPLPEGRAAFFNLDENETRSFTLHAADGGLFQIETLGRLQTLGEIGTHFIATLATAQNNGAGHNMRLMPWLRAGDYTLRVTAQAGTGHLGLQASRAPLLQTETLTPGGSVRDTVAAGTGRSIPIEVPQDGTYQISVIGQGEGFSGRLEDSDGWPLVSPGGLEEQTITLRAGHDRLVVTPGTTDQRMVASLLRIVPETPIIGHGPHPLVLGKQISAMWREPKPGDPNRIPDSFTFSLAGAAHAHVALSDGMEAVLTGPGKPLRISGNFDGDLAAGTWRLEATAQGRNDRLDYTLRIDTDELQPGIPRTVQLNSTTPFIIAAARVVTLATTGRAATKAVLRSASGHVIARAGARDHDWNTAISQRLSAGSYTIEILPGMPPGVQPTSQARFGQNDGGDDTPAPPPPITSQDEGSTAPDMPQADESDASGYSAPPEAHGYSREAGGQTTLHLDLPQDLPTAPAPQALAVLHGAGVHILSFPAPPAGALALATAQGAGTSIVSIERQDEHGAWQALAQGNGASALAAALSDGGKRPWRAAVWSLDDAAAPVSAAVRAVTEAPTDRLAPVPGLGVSAARLAMPAPVVLDVTGPAGMMQAGFPGHGATELTGGHALPQGQVVWLFGPAAGKITVKPADESRMNLDIPEAAAAYLPNGKVPPGVLRVWRADSGDGQPGFSDGADQGAVAPFSAVVRGAASPVLQNAGGKTVMRAQIERHDLSVLPPQTLGAGLSIKVAPGKAVPLDNAGNPADVQVSLAPGLAAFVGDQAAIWAPVSPLTRTVAGSPRIVIANLSDVAAVAGIAPVPHVGATALRPGSLEKRFFGAAGSFELPADVPDHGEIHVAGNASLLVRDATGRVFTGSRAIPASGPARVAVTHGPGLVVLWIDTPGQKAWPDAPATNAALPGVLPLAGPAMSLRLPLSGPMLLHASTTAPVLLGLAGEDPVLFESGAEYHRAIDGPASLRVISAVDGPLSGTLALSAEKLRPLGEGLGETVMIAPGGSAAFAFTLQKTATIGIGVRAEPDAARVRVLNEAGKSIGEGVAQLLRKLPAGRYVLEARVPPDAAPTRLRPALLGSVPRSSGPPPEIVRSYLEEAGFKPTGAP